MRVGFIGAGKVATAFGRYLHGHGIAISGYFDRHVEKVTHASETTQSKVGQSAAEVTAGSDIILITTRDDQIESACNDLCRQKAIGPRHLVGHMSGAHASHVLTEAAQQGAAIFSLHPLQAFAEEEKALTDLPSTYLSLEGDDQRLVAVEEILAKIGNRYFKIAAEHKSLYHLSACVLSNYLVTLMDSGLEALKMSGIDSREGFRAMRPLIEGTIANIARMGTDKALTGPIARGDATTIGQHLDALDAHGLEDLKQDYIFWGLKTLELATRVVLKEPDKADTLRKILGSSRPGFVNHRRD